MERRIAEKIHKRLDFPDVIFMDRYMLRNRDGTRQKREQVRRFVALSKSKNYFSLIYKTL
jgi:hypothetical protein